MVRQRYRISVKSAFDLSVSLQRSGEAIFQATELGTNTVSCVRANVPLPVKHDLQYREKWRGLLLRCSVDDDLNVKVTDCALSRDLFPQDYCCLGDNENRPVKWMAVESLEQGRYTVASDVVSVESLPREYF